MNTKQLIILWYGAILLIVLLLARVKSNVGLAVAGLLLFLLLLYSFGRHHRASKHKLMIAVVLPMLLLGVGAFVWDGSMVYENAPPAAQAAVNFIPPSNVQLLSAQVQRAFFTDGLSGQIQNNSQETIRSLLVRVTLSDDAGPAKVSDVAIRNLAIAPNTTGNFAKGLEGFNVRLGKHWKWSVQLLAAAGN